MAEPNFRSCIAEAELRARAAYAEPHRHYHDERHLDECLRQLDQVDDLSGRERQLLRWAILWHDAIYDPGLTGNEEHSAILAERELSACGVEAADAAEVARLIRLTERHKADPIDRLGALLISIDLAILGSDPDRYRRYVRDVRAENTHVPDPMWRTGRSEVLQRLLRAEPLYPEPGFRDRFEAQARLNMDDELKTLAAG